MHPVPCSPSWGTQYTGPSSVVSKEEKEPRDDQDGEGCSTTEGGSMKLQFRVFSRSWWATVRARNCCQCLFCHIPPVPAASQEGRMLHSSPLPSVLLGVRDSDSIQGMGTPLAAQSHEVPQPSGHRSHQPAVVVTSRPHVVGSRVCSSLTLPSIPVSSCPN